MLVFGQKTLVTELEAADRADKDVLDKDSTDDPMPFLGLDPLTDININFGRKWDETDLVSIHFLYILPKLSD